MKASIVDLRYKTREILDALERNESVTVLYHGRVKGVIRPAGKQVGPVIAEHPFFGMHAAMAESVEDEMERLRQPRHDV
jgi:acyl-coenzyme A synthetase/AMP-(fatty) acid ligase